MKILTFVSFFLPGYKAGGPIRTLDNLFCRLSAKGYDFSVVTSDRDLGDKSPYMGCDSGKWHEKKGYSVFYATNGIQGLVHILKCLYKDNSDIVYLNSFFSIKFSIIPLFIMLLRGKSIILAPRGEFSRGALQIKPLRKKLYISLFKIAGIYRSVHFQASSDFERDDIISVIGEKCKVYIASDIPSTPLSFSEQVNCSDEGYIRMVFLSRVSPIKNLDFALDVLYDVTANVKFDIYGPIASQGYWRKCLDKIEALPSNVIVQYKGIVHPGMVQNVLNAYDLFFLPTKGENYCHAITEAFMSGVLVLIPDTTPWLQLAEQGIGWNIPLNQKVDFVNVIETLSRLPSQKKRERKVHVSTWAKEFFSGEKELQDNIAMFNSVCK